MLGDLEMMATVAVRDVAKARKFYEGVLGLERDEGDEMDVAVYRGRGSKLFVYPSQFAGTNQATAVTWTVEGDIAELVRELRARGVTFEHYDLPGTRREGDLHIAGGFRNAWFKDPDGNIHALVGS